MKPLTLLALASLLSFQACDRKVMVVENVLATPVPEAVAQTKTIETSRLGEAVRDYEREPSEANGAAVRKALAELDGEIAELQEYVATHEGDAKAEAAAKLRNLKAYRASEALRFTAAQAKSTAEVPVPADARSGAQKVEDTAQKVGNEIESAAKGAAEAIKDAVR